MPARWLLMTFDSAYVLALAAWVGAILFFSFGVAPIIFRVLGAESAATFVRALFPRYYAWGVGATAIALPSLACGALAVPELRGPAVLVQAIAIVLGLAIMLYCGNSLTPAINAARDAGPEQAARFDRLHRRSVRLNGVALVLGVLLLVAFASRPPARTEGIIEPTPQARADAATAAQALDAIVRRQVDRDAAGGQPRDPFRLDDLGRREFEELVEARRAQTRRRP